jgi:hypothetical protein
MQTIKGPALFLAQFAGDAAPFNSWKSITALGRRLRLCRRADPQSWDGRLFDLEKAAASKDYCDEVKGVAAENGVDGDRAFHPPAGPAGGRASGL